MTTFTAKDKLQCAEREVGYRHRVYGRLVKRGKMSQLDAWREIALMEAIVEDYRVAASVIEPEFALFVETRRTVKG